MPAKTVTVKVCGRRPNAGAPQSWWVDTGIYITAGSQLSFDPTRYNNFIRTWNGGPNWTPAGKPDETTWHDTLSYRESEVELPSFSLIGKIGRGGLPFHIGGAVRSFTPNATGTLFLACNDGYSFEDNSGYWEIRVTFEELVILRPTGYGTNQIYADRIDRSLVETYGVILTVQNVQSTTASIPSWDATAIGNVTSALSAIDSRLQNRAGRSFKDVFRGLELRFFPTQGDIYGVTFNENLVRFGLGARTNANRIDNREYGRNIPTAGAGSTLDYYPSVSGFYTANSKGIQNTIIHELGHVLAKRSSRFGQTASAFGLKVVRAPSQTDSPSDIGTFWENYNPTNDPLLIEEQYADNFLNWVRNSYFGIEGVVDTNTGGTSDQQRVSAFWAGRTFGTATSPGITGFANDANASSTGAVSLLYNLGVGEPYPNCSF